MSEGVSTPAPPDTLESLTSGSQTSDQSELQRHRRCSPTTKEDIELFRSVASLQPDDTRRGRRLEQWQLVADKVNRLPATSDPCTAVYCRNRYNYLISQGLSKPGAEPLDEKLHQLKLEAIENRKKRLAEKDITRLRQTHEYCMVVGGAMPGRGETVEAPETPLAPRPPDPDPKPTTGDPPSSPVEDPEASNQEDQAASDDTQSPAPSTTGRARGDSQSSTPPERPPDQEGDAAAPPEESRNSNAGKRPRPVRLRQVLSASKRCRVTERLQRDVAVLNVKAVQGEAMLDELSKDTAVVKVAQAKCAAQCEARALAQEREVGDLREGLKAETQKRVVLEDDIKKTEAVARRAIDEMHETRALQQKIVGMMEAWSRDHNAVLAQCKSVLGAQR